MSESYMTQPSNPRSYTVAGIRERASQWIGTSTPDTAIGEEILAFAAMWACDEIERLALRLELETAALEQSCSAPIAEPLTTREARLTAEIERLRRECEARLELAQGLTRELEDLRKYSVERSNLLGAVAYQGTEISRLRTALERIAKDEPDYLAHEVARKALAEVSDEKPLPGIA